MKDDSPVKADNITVHVFVSAILSVVIWIHPLRKNILRKAYICKSNSFNTPPQPGVMALIFAVSNSWGHFTQNVFPGKKSYEKLSPGRS